MPLRMSPLLIYILKLTHKYKSIGSDETEENFVFYEFFCLNSQVSIMKHCMRRLGGGYNGNLL